MDRRPVVAGQFYPGRADQLQEQVKDFLGTLSPMPRPTLLAMVPHAGYVFSGGVAGRTLAQANLARISLLLGPNHTGMGAPLALWDSGTWLIPGGGIRVDEEFAQALAGADPRVTPDSRAHAQEHSLEVVIPFLYALNPNMRVAPLAVAERSLSVLLEVAEAVAGLIESWKEPVSMIVSSDMSHFLPHEDAKERDSLALKPILELDPEGLYETVRAHNITMCGVLPMTLALAVARRLGATEAKLVDYATSGDAMGDYQRVVGYAGVLVS